VPNVFSLTGWAGGIVLFCGVTTLNIYTMQLNLDVAARHPKIRSYSEMTSKLMGLKGKIVCDAAIWVGQLGTCCSYLYFIAD
jgi:amino acid permease